MSDFYEWFRSKYQTDFPIAVARTLHKQDNLVWVSEELDGKLEHPPMVPEFYDRPGDYAIAGEWGHGVNSYAFYFIERRGPHRRFFRVFSGGVYGRPEEDARTVVAYLTGYQRWRDRFEGVLSESTLVCNMGNSTADLVKASGETLSHRGYEEGDAWWQALETRMP